MGFVAVRSVQELLIKARLKLGLTQREMADRMQSSLRTVTRWEAKRATPADFHYHRLAALLYPHDANLAHDAAFAGGTTPERLGLVPPPAPASPPVEPPAAPPAAPVAPPAPAPPPLPPRLLVDSVVCAVAEALEALDGAPVPLQRARVAVAAAFVRAGELGLSTADAASVFTAPAPDPGAPDEPAATRAPVSSSTAKRGSRS
jgi:DNA-binding XRE family transcriptional regulator